MIGRTRCCPAPFRLPFLLETWNRLQQCCYQSTLEVNEESRREKLDGMIWWTGKKERLKFWSTGGTFPKLSMTVNDTVEMLLQTSCSPQHSYPDILETSTHVHSSTEHINLAYRILVWCLWILRPDYTWLFQTWDSKLRVIFLDTLENTIQHLPY